MRVSRDSPVFTAAVYELDDGKDGVRVSLGSRIFMYLHVVQLNK
jgi:hypothetical protein